MFRFVALVLLVPAAAAADPDHFVTIDRQDDSSRAGADVSKVFYPTNTGIVGSDIIGVRVDLHAQYVTPNAVGAYVSMPIGYVSGNDVSHTAVSDAEAGAIFIPQLAASHLKLVLHAGLALPTLSKDADAAATSRLTVWPRITDYYQTIPEGLTLRFGCSPIVRDGRLFFRGDIGVDATLSADQGADVTNGLRLNAGVGVDLGLAAVMLESTNIRVGGKDTVWLDTAALSARFDGGPVSPYAALVFGVDHDAHSFMHEAITLGLDGRLR
jgi:hypothetical protein